MARIIIDHVTNRVDLLEALSVVLRAMNQPGAFANQERVFLRAGAEAEQQATSRLADHSHVDEPLHPDPAADLCSCIGPTPYAPCDNRGTHRRLTDCWMCWSDVMRGAALEAEVLSVEAWQDGLDDG